jgi:hypothetical protein
LFKRQVHVINRIQKLLVDSRKGRLRIVAYVIMTEPTIIDAMSKAAIIEN